MEVPKSNVYNDFLNDVAQGISTHLEMYSRLESITNGFNIDKLTHLSDDILEKIKEIELFIELDGIGIENKKNDSGIRRLEINKHFLQQFHDYILTFIKIEIERISQKKTEQFTEIGILFAQGRFSPDPFKGEKLLNKVIFDNKEWNSINSCADHLNTSFNLNNSQPYINATLHNITTTESSKKNLLLAPKQIKKVMETCIIRGTAVTPEFKALHDSLEN